MAKNLSRWTTVLLLQEPAECVRWRRTGGRGGRLRLPAKPDRNTEFVYVSPRPWHSATVLGRREGGEVADSRADGAGKCWATMTYGVGASPPLGQLCVADSRAGMARDR